MTEKQAKAELYGQLIDEAEQNIDSLTALVDVLRKSLNDEYPGICQDTQAISKEGMVYSPERLMRRLMNLDQALTGVPKERIIRVIVSNPKEGHHSEHFLSEEFHVLVLLMIKAMTGLLHKHHDPARTDMLLIEHKRDE